MGIDKYNNLDEEELFIQAKNMELESVYDVMEDLLFNDTFFGLAMTLYSDSWNNLTIKERKKQLETINAYVSGYFQGELIAPELIIDGVLDDSYVSIKDDFVTVHEKAIENKNSGFFILKNYMNNICKHYIYKSVLEIDDEHPSMSEKTRDYYFNSCRSLLFNTWNNYLSIEDPHYYDQPIVIDAFDIIENLFYKFIKKFYNLYGVIDSEIGALLDMHIEYVGEKEERDALYNVMKDKNVTNALKLKKEAENIVKFLNKTKENFSKFSDDEFFELFNVHYKYFITHEDECINHRIASFFNELIRRVFKDVDTSHVVFPNYNVRFKNNNTICIFNKGLENCKEIETDDFNELLKIVLQDIEHYAHEYELYKFKDEEERENYKIMKEWLDFKGKIQKGTFEYDIISSNLNIKSIKLHELFYNLSSKIDIAISKSNFTPHGMSIISYSDDNQSYYDFEEFKTGCNKEEMARQIMSLVKEDLEKIKSNNTLVKKGGVR